MNIVDWYKKRGTRFIIKRAKTLRDRYTFSSEKAILRIRDCVDRLMTYECHPTFFVPGVVVKRNPVFIQELQDKGCEIGVHGYQHIDMKSLSPQDAIYQLQRAVGVFKNYDLHVDGFRCPYLSISDEIIQKLEPGQFNYSSNRAIGWTTRGAGDHQKTLLFDTIKAFYQPAFAQSTLSLPYCQGNILEIPVSVPDDIQMRDGMNYSPDEIASTLLDIFKQIHARGELYNLMFHPELASLLITPFMAVLADVSGYKGRVWIVSLRDIGQWWKEKGEYRVSINRSNGAYHLEIDAPKRATLLQKGLIGPYLLEDWDGKYQRFADRQIIITHDQLPIIGISSDLPTWVPDALDRKGYIFVNLDEWENCTIKITNDFMINLFDTVRFIDAVESIDAPLVRFWPWPDGFRSALCLSGDLDALSLMDYATRLLPS